MHILRIFIIMSHRISTTTLFPYTTLFRSLHVEDDPNDAEFVENALKQFSVGINLRSVRDGVFAKQYLEGQGKYADRELHPLPEDRKSTRLNSSHRTISYAVFCLKKKHKRN